MLFLQSPTKIGLIIVSILLTSFCLIRQNPMVSSLKYNILLQALLDHSVNEISVVEVVDKPDVLLLDARSKNEYEVSHIKNAVWVGYEEFSARKVQDIDRQKEIVVYCSVGYRSEKIAEKLVKFGYSNVSNLYGGIFEWVNEDNDIANESGEVTTKIHAYNKQWGIWLSKGDKVYTE